MLSKSRELGRLRKGVHKSRLDRFVARFGILTCTLVGLKPSHILKHEVAQLMRAHEDEGVYQKQKKRLLVA
jgi:hypothetical protein